ncbi:MAG: OB-fold nucleic acid binding domain-containing protein [Candidatus Odinarchaeota archaeon]
MSYPQIPILKRVIDDLIGRYSDIIIAIYGIGSYFDDTLPPNWVKNDIDIIVIVKSLEPIPKPDWTDVAYKKKEINGYEVWVGFNTIQGYQNRYNFSKESFSNYEWSLIDLRHPENSILLYGKDIRDQLPGTDDLNFDYDDLLARGLYHIDKYLKEQDLDIAKKELSKGIFKCAFYFCILSDPHFRRTSVIEIGNKLKTLREKNEFIKKISEFFEEALLFRITGQYKSDFIGLQENIINFIFSKLEDGSLHKEMNYFEIVSYLGKTYSGFSNLLTYVYKSDLFQDKRIVIANITLNMRNITLSGWIKQIFGVYTFDKEEGTKGKVGSFLLSDRSGEIRVVLWDDNVKYMKGNEFNIGRSVYVIDGYSKEGKEGGIEVHVSSYGSIYILHPEREEKKAKEKELIKNEVAKRLEFLKDAKSIKIPCPFCGFLCSPNLKKCRKCGEPLPRI